MAGSLFSDLTNLNLGLVHVQDQLVQILCGAPLFCTFDTQAHTRTQRKNNEFLEPFPSENVGGKASVLPCASVVQMFSCRKCQEHMISHFQNRYVPRSLPCPPPLILHCIVIYSSHHNALINGARVLHSRPLPSLSWSRLTYMSYMRRTVYDSRRRKVTQTVLFSKKLANRKRLSAFSCQTRAKVGVRVTTFIVTMGKDSKHQHQ